MRFRNLLVITDHGSDLTWYPRFQDTYLASARTSDVKTRPIEISLDCESMFSSSVGRQLQSKVSADLRVSPLRFNRGCLDFDYSESRHQRKQNYETMIPLQAPGKIHWIRSRWSISDSQEACFCSLSLSWGDDNWGKQKYTSNAFRKYIPCGKKMTLLDLGF